MASFVRFGSSLVERSLPVSGLGPPRETSTTLSVQRPQRIHCNAALGVEREEPQEHLDRTSRFLAREPYPQGRSGFEIRKPVTDCPHPYPRVGGSGSSLPLLLCRSTDANRPEHKGTGL